MNKRIKARWVKALRSGDYTQGKNSLRGGCGVSTTHCCLGVLCELAVKSGVLRKYDGVGFEGSVEFLPKVVADWANLSSYDPKVANRRLSDHNDGLEHRRAKTFNQIATLIEKHL